MIWYLGGPIRRKTEFEEYDKYWRDRLVRLVFNRGLKESFRDPMSFDGDFPSILQHNHVVGLRDRMLMDQCHAGIFNLLPFSDGYPCIGAIWEMGYMTAQNKPVFVASTGDCILRHHPMTFTAAYFDTMEELTDALFLG